MKNITNKIADAFKLSLAKSALLSVVNIIIIECSCKFWYYSLSPDATNKIFKLEEMYVIMAFAIWYLPLSIYKCVAKPSFLKYIKVVIIYYGLFFVCGQYWIYRTIRHEEHMAFILFILYLSIIFTEFIYKLFEEIHSNKVPPIDTRNARMLLLSAFYRGLTIYFLVIIVWPYIFRPDSVSSLVDLSNPSLVINLFANIKTLLIFFLLSIPTVFISKFIHTYLVRKNKRIYENILVLSSIVVYVTILNIIISSFFPAYASKELFGHIYLLSTFTELFFIHFINQKLNTEQALENIS